jgi:hypothetical protein
MNKYTVSVWNLEKIHAKSEAEAVARIKEEFYGGLYGRRDFEFDDVELVEEELTDEDLAVWNLCKSNAPYPEQSTCEVAENFSLEGDEHLVIIICSVLVEAEDEEEAMENANDCFYYINKDEFEIRISG